MNTTFLSIIIPCFNEKKSLLRLIAKIKKIKNIKKQIILVDDGSNDGTTEIIKKKLINKIDKIIFHKKNQGKGSAIKSAKKYIKGNFVIIQDADLEYYPTDYHKLLNKLKNKNLKVVYGSRVLGRTESLNFLSIKNFAKNFRIMGNYFLTFISNFINNQSLTDVHTCYKMFDKKIFLSLNIQEKGFSFCPEVTTKIAKLSYPIAEVPIKYNGREIKDGKKIRLKDAFIAIYTILKYRYFD
ncbi:glycosyltransferase family 2 protein [Candidatus Pelagibacter sp.]|nr:glycosyltransferase family 2 protein [Candidatus Pelagibacter sp.]